MITYIIQIEGAEPLVKFGRSKNPKSRLATLSTGVPWSLRTVCYIGSDCEAELKRKFKADHVRGEWYRPTAALQQWIDEAAAAGKLVKQVEVDQAYINAVIKPRIQEYLSGRDPANNAGGDFVRCIFADILPTLQGRENELVSATKGHVSLTLANGFGPAVEGGTLILPASIGEQPATQASAAA